MCYSIAFVENCMNFASILSMLMITTERYYVICKPLKVKSVMTQSRTFRIIVFIWLISISCNLPYIFLTEYYVDHFSDNKQLEYKCNAKSRENWTFLYIISTTFLVYVIIGVILVFLYTKISENLNKSNKFLASNRANKTNKNRSDHQASISDENLTLTEINASIRNNNNNTNNSTNNKKASCVSESEDTSRKPAKLTFNFISKKKAVTSETKTNDKNELDMKTIRNRRKLIYMLKCVIILFYVCLFPLKTWSLGRGPFF